MAAIIATSAPRPTRIVTPSASISMPPISGLALRGAVLRSWPTATAGTKASTTSGTNGGSSAIGVGNRRACRRQVNTCCGVSLCRRAISETKAPGTSVSSTIRALSSLQNQRRRPVSVITRRVSSHGSSEPAPVSSPRSPTASRRMRRRYGRQSLHHGPTDRLKVRSRASSSFDVKCTAAAKSICSKPD
jgi:hypothetical protein